MQPDLEARVHQRVLALDGHEPLDDAFLTELVRTEDPLLDDPGVCGVVARVRARILGVGAIEPLLADPSVTDVMVNGPGQVWIERAGRLCGTDITVERTAIDILVERVVARLGLRADRANPIVDARLPDGSRVHVVLPPLAVDGPYVTIRRFGAATLPLSAFAAAPVAELLVSAVAAGRNIVVSGGTGAGKTTLLNALCQHLPDGERVVTVEDAAELRLPGTHVVRLEARPASPDGLEAVTIRELLHAALRMRPDRLVVGECRGSETLDMVQAMNTGHDGSLSTCHANGPIDALRRIETMSLMADVALPLTAVREQIAGAIDLVVHVARRSDGTRHVASIAEVSEDPESPLRAHLVAESDHLVAPLLRPERHPTPTPQEATP
jgi:pilus assembly protein CpaF